MTKALRFWANNRLHYPTSYEVVQNTIIGQVSKIRFRNEDDELLECKPSDAMPCTGKSLCEIPLYVGDILRFKTNNCTECGVIAENEDAPGTFGVHTCGQPTPIPLEKILSNSTVLLVGNTRETPNAALMLLSVTIESITNNDQPCAENTSGEGSLETVLYTDGCCLSNPGGDGGWAFVIMNGEEKHCEAGFLPNCTNNIAELTAVIEGLKRIPGTGRSITIYSDSKYVINGFTEGWLENWKRNGWISSSGSPVKNIALWEQLDSLSRKHDCSWKWVKGHASNEYNNLCDKLACQAASKKKPIIY